MRATPKMIKNKTYGRAICNQKHCGGTAKGEVDSEGSNLSEVSVRDTKPIASQESSPQLNKEILREMFAQSINDKFVEGYKEVDTMINGYKQQAREETLREIQEDIYEIIEFRNYEDRLESLTDLFKRLGEGEKK